MMLIGMTHLTRLEAVIYGHLVPCRQINMLRLLGDLDLKSTATHHE